MMLMPYAITIRYAAATIDGYAIYIRHITLRYAIFQLRYGADAAARTPLITALITPYAIDIALMATTIHSANAA